MFYFLRPFQKTSEPFLSNIFLCLNTTCFGSCPVHVRYTTGKAVCLQIFGSQRHLWLNENDPNANASLTFHPYTSYLSFIYMVKISTSKISHQKDYKNTQKMYKKKILVKSVTWKISGMLWSEARLSADFWLPSPSASTCFPTFPQIQIQIQIQIQKYKYKREAYKAVMAGYWGLSQTSH